MKRGLAGLVLLTVVMLSGAVNAAAPCPPRQSGYGEWIRVNTNGVITYRYTYRGKVSGFPPPAMYYYGYPGSGFSYGMGF
jgi:hypothetical protein